MYKTLFVYIGYFTLISSLFPLFFAYLKRKTLSKELRVLFLWIFISFITDITTVIMSEYKLNNLFVFHIYTVFEYVLIGYIFHLIYKDRKLSFLILFSLLFLLLISILDAFYFHSVREMNSLTVFIESIIIISFTGIYFYRFLQKLEFTNPLSDPMFWFNSAVLFYFSGNLFLFIFSNYVLNEPANMLWVINHIINILFKLILCLAFWKATVKTI